MYHPNNFIKPGRLRRSFGDKPKTNTDSPLISNRNPNRKMLFPKFAEVKMP